MRTGKDNEMRVILHILKHPEKDYNANNLAGELKLSSMGILKIARRLEQEGILLLR